MSDLYKNIIKRKAKITSTAILLACVGGFGLAVAKSESGYSKQESYINTGEGKAENLESNSNEELISDQNLVTSFEKTNSKKNKKYTKFTSGTGFFVSNSHIITNDHVVKDCKMIKIRGNIEPGFARVQAVDSVNDLALLKTSRTPHRIAKLRGDNMPLNIGDDVTVIGYPLDRGIKGQHLLKRAVLTNVNDVYEGSKRIQFTDSVEKGNSGGPLLDSNGNVIGVIVGKMSFYLAGADLDDDIKSKPIKTSSVAIRLESLKNFLVKNKVYYRENKINYHYSSDSWMENKAKEYIVNIHCIKD